MDHIRPCRLIAATDAAGAVRPSCDVEKDLIRIAIEIHAGNIQAARRDLGLSANTMYRRLKQYGIVVKRSWWPKETAT